uniref:blue copper protein 1a-like n=1 Tax=Erigeron canadensis TaxID=72917 RepID=UPI001CB92C0D|nr:blue copper protein 1a-like [Erigeron canadensis]
MAWTEGKEFDIGDKLVFKYPKGKHNVFRVGEQAWNECIIPPENEALATGNDEVTLDTAGGVGFISGVGQDCKNGMRLLVNVICPYAKPKQPVQGARKLVEKH